MKKIRMYLVTFLALASSSAKAGSDLCINRFPEGSCGPITKIVCSYKSINRSNNTLTFELPENMDFRHLSGPTVNLKGTKNAEGPLYRVSTQVQGSRTLTQLDYQHPFFISDIQLIFEKETQGNVLLNPVKGRWTTDYPPVIEMDCGFVWEAVEKGP